MQLPEQFGEYTLVRQLAIGGMGELYLAQRPGVAGFSKQLVVKRIRPQLAHDRSFVEMFLNEGRVAAMIDHPNVVHIYELGEVNGAYFMAMEYVAGKDLGTLLSRNEGPLNLPNSLIVINGICEGIGFAHRASGPDGQPLGLVHRDLNPQNVLISYSGTVKITDFGIAKARLEHRKETQAGVLKGKFGYLSPEQARGRSVDLRSDIYSLGLLLFEITVGRPAIPGKSDTQRLYAAAEGVVQRPKTFAADYPPDLETIYLKATAKRPEDRYQSVKELQEALLGFQVERRLVTISSKLADLMDQLFAEDVEEDQRGITPVQVSKEPLGGQVQIGPPGRGDAKQVDPDFHLAQTVMEARSPVAEDDQLTVEETPLPPPREGDPALTAAETKMLARSSSEEKEASSPAGSEGGGLMAAETKLLDREQPPVADKCALDLLAITVPRDPKATATVQPAKQRSRWPVILLSTVITLCVAGSMTYYFLVYRPAVEAHTKGGAGDAQIRTNTDSKLQTDDDASMPQTAPLPDAAADTPDGPLKPSGGVDAQPDTVGAPGPSVPSTAGERVPVHVRCTPSVRVYWRGRRLGRTPLKASLPPGGHRLRLRNRELGINVIRFLRVPRRGEKRAGYEVKQGVLLIKARPWAHVEVDGRRQGTTPIKPLKLYEGTHVVKLTNDEHGTHTTRVAVRPGETTRLVHRFEE